MPTAAPRTNPRQTRAKDTFERLQQAARDAIADVGRDAFTTHMVADRAGVSIGTVYRYFEDRIAILDLIYPNRVEGLDRDGYADGVHEALQLLTDLAGQSTLGPGKLWDLRVRVLEQLDPTDEAEA